MNAKQQAFLEFYLQTRNASEAARLAGYKGKPNVIGPRLLANVSIKAAVDERLGQLKMTSDEVLEDLAKIARFDQLQFMTFHVHPELGQFVYINLEEIKNAGLGHVVKEIGYDKQGRQVVKFHDPMTARQWIGQNLKLFTQKHELDVKNLPELTSALKDMVAGIYGDDESGGDEQ
jgi:phage terminase small subunit